MSSLGNEVYCGNMTVSQNLRVTGAVTSSHKVFGSSMNQGQLHHNGSIFYIKWSAVHQCTTLATTSGSTTVTWTTNAAHGLSISDTIHIGSIPNNPTAITSVNGIPASELSGTHVVTSTTTNTLSYTVTTQANVTGSTTNAVPHVRIDRYKSIDLATDDVTWTHGTTVPTPAHTNTETFYF